MDLTPKTKKKWVKWTVALFIVSILLFLTIQNIDAVRAFFSWCLYLTLPLIVGAAIAIIFNVPMKFFEEYLWKNTKRSFLRSIRRPTAFILSAVIIIGCLVGIVMIIIPELIASIKIIISGAIDLIKKFNGMTPEEYAELPFGNLLMQVDWNEALNTLQTWIKTQSGAILKGAFSTLSSVVTAIFDLIIAFVFAVYLIFNKDKIKSHSARLVRVWLPERFANWLIHATNITSTNFKSFISGQTLEALILGVLCLLGMWIFKIPYAPMVSVLVGITALIPVIGGFIGGGIGAFMILTVDPSKTLFFLIFLVILQQLEGNIIYPRVMGKKVHLPGLLILAAVTIGGGIAGPVGMLLSVPLTSTAYTLINEATLARELSLSSANAENENTESKGEETPKADSTFEEEGECASKEKEVKEEPNKNKKSPSKKAKSKH